ncbi:hypothetical protein BGW36DRAFT_373268 [Talaromyces proteolyticus]|uniref:Uncharacterized protein n=1 Tax=Talaromyces proteolyticus TaxID=1131652 RepID=A0AAD4Q4E0_9EURO|nr:uncharacterized protein BGW36DRAFT_373268 [Talaromyces proteolyticus]KAH8702636.1 hypothetical protein BGW36DRAFT_373268 [Talaromyces proteolyticus]
MILICLTTNLLTAYIINNCTASTPTILKQHPSIGIGVYTASVLSLACLLGEGSAPAESMPGRDSSMRCLEGTMIGLLLSDK